MTDRQKTILNLVVKSYILYNTPISSGYIKEKFNLNISTSTIRNEMFFLENEKYIEKSFENSGRVPTNKAYEFYVKNLNVNLNKKNSFFIKIEKIFLERKNNLEKAIEESLKIINFYTNTLSITKEEDRKENLEDLKLYKINSDTLLFVVITSEGKIYNKEIKLINQIKFEYLTNIFKLLLKRLKGISIFELNKKSDLISKVLKNELSYLEDSFKEFIVNVFEKILNQNDNKSFVNNLVNTSFIKNTENLEKIINLIKEQTIWELIEKSNKISNNKTNFLFNILDLELEDLSMIERNFSYKDKTKKIILIGSKNQDYEEITNVLNLLEEKIIES